MTSIQLESLWSYIQSLNLSKRNRTWLSNKLIENQANTESVSNDTYKKKVIAGIDSGLNDVKEGRTVSAWDLLEELRNE